jgi:two-component system, response regulator PdtaR
MPHGASRSVLVVDDEPILRLFACEALEEAGYEVVGASSADEAIALLRRGTPFGAVLTDIEMPGDLDGLELAWNIQAHWPEITVVITSGRKLPRPDEIPRAASFLPKPFSADRLVDTMRSSSAGEK